MAADHSSLNMRETIKDVLGNFRITDWRYLAFYIGAPMGLGIYSALNNWHLLNTAGYMETFGFYLAQAIPPYWITSICSTLVMIALHPWKPPSVVIMLLGVWISCFFSIHYIDWVSAIYAGRWQNLPVSEQFPTDYSIEFWMFVIRASLLWVICNLVFDRFIGLPRYRYVLPRGYDDRTPSGTKATQSTTDGDNSQQFLPGFLERLPVPVGPDEIIAIKAEQHYIGIHTPDRYYMVLYRFRDAVRELDADLGLQVHRSYWVNKKAIECLHTDGKKFGVCMSNGEFIPVSVPYQGIVKQLAKEMGTPSRPLAVHNQ